jgi:hypothetical protein
LFTLEAICISGQTFTVVMITSIANFSTFRVTGLALKKDAIKSRLTILKTPAAFFRVIDRRVCLQAALNPNGIADVETEVAVHTAFASNSVAFHFNPGIYFGGLSHRV